jgi:hypothetical protein
MLLILHVSELVLHDHTALLNEPKGVEIREEEKYTHCSTQVTCIYRCATLSCQHEETLIVHLFGITLLHITVGILSVPEDQEICLFRKLLKKSK